MSTVLEILRETQEECNQLHKWLQQTAPSLENFFAMLHNHAMSAEEILDSIGPLIVKTKKEGLQRIMLVLRATWVFQLAVVEYSMKRIIRQSKGPLAEWYDGLRNHTKVKGMKKGFSLRTVVWGSFREGIIERDQCDNWIALQDMRNAIIHNNGYVEEDKTYKVGKFSRNIKAGEKIRSRHLDRAYFIQLIPRMSKDWLEGFLRKHTLT